MKRVVTAQEMRDYERVRFENKTASSLDWMERAAQGVQNLLWQRYPESSVLVVCGGGNNGGDGFALLRLLKKGGVLCAGVLLADPSKITGDAKVNYQRALDLEIEFFPNLSEALVKRFQVLVDAMFGTGLSRPLDGVYADAVQIINNGKKPVVAVDIPSGVDAANGKILGCAVRASETVTFEFYKRGQLLFPGRDYCGEVFVQPLSKEEDLAFGEPEIALFTRKDAALLLPRRPIDSHKGSNGRALLCVGSERYTGAALLSVGAALRAGAGLTTAAVPGTLKQAFSVLPEAMAVPLNETGVWDEQACQNASALLFHQNAVCVGCGVGEGNILPLLEQLLKIQTPAVLDADALNQLSKSPAILSNLHPNVILTPHPAEMARLCGESLENILADPIGTARTYAKEWNCVVLLKGATTCVSNGNTVRLNASGNAGLAKGGSGDVLSGLITGLLAQGLAAYDAAITGAYLLGVSADAALELLGERMLLARDVIGAIEQTIRRF